MPRKPENRPVMQVTTPSPHEPSLDDILNSMTPPVAPEPTLGEVVDTDALVPSQPTMPGFEMSDEPIDPPGLDAQKPPVDIHTDKPDLRGGEGASKAATPLKGDRKKDKNKPQRFVSRISVTDAYQFDGQVHRAPDWVSREWAAYDDGPTLYIPSIGATARVGDYVVKQDVVLDDDVRAGRLEVYKAADFERLFMPS